MICVRISNMPTDHQLNRKNTFREVKNKLAPNQQQGPSMCPTIKQDGQQQF